MTEEYKKQGKNKLEEDKRYQSAQKDIADAKERIKAAEEVRERYKLYQDEKDKKGKQKDPILEALKLEISLVEKLRADYEKLTKAGASQADALATIHEAYGKTIKQLNTELKSFGLPQLDIAKIITGKDPQKQLDHFTKTLETLVENGLLNIERSKVVEAIIEKLKVSAKEYDFTEISKGIERGLEKLKEQFELGTALDAEPQLGNLFATMYGFDTKELPRTFNELVEKAQDVLNRAFFDRGKASVDVSAILDKKIFEEWAKTSGKELDSTLVQAVQKVREYLVEQQRKMISDTNKEYDKLLERYSEYQFRLIKIDKDAAAERLALIRKFAKEEDTLRVRKAAEIVNKIAISNDPEERERLSKGLQSILKEVARDDRAVIQIGIGIDTKAAEEKAQVAFDEFTKNPVWRTAIGDLEGMTHDALRSLIADLEDFRNANKKLTPKQINQIEKTIKSLHKQIRKGNPFLALADEIDRAADRTKVYEDDIRKLEAELASLQALPEHKKTEDDRKEIIRLRKEIEKLEKEMLKVGRIDISTVFSHINESISAVSEISSSITKMLDALGGEQATEASKTISDITGNLEAAGRGAQIGSSFGGYGAAIGAIAGGLTDLVTRFADFWSGNAAITKKIEESVRSVKKLEIAYSDLEYQIKKTYGEGETYAKKVALANKKAQLAELQYQLALEESRKSKNRDKDKTLDLQGQINDLANEIDESLANITNDLLGISSVKDAATTLVESMIDAFKKGENYMEQYANSFEEMIEKMIANAVLSRLIGDKVQSVVDYAQSLITPDTDVINQQIEELKFLKEDLEKERIYITNGATIHRDGVLVTEELLNKEEKELDDRINALNQALKEEGEITPEKVDALRKYTEGASEGVKEMFDALMDAFGIKFGQDTNLANLQQGIQSITEDTASALEAYMNGVSQQCYVQTELLTEIRDAVVSINGDAALGVQSQMLLQLQNNYIIMQAMQSIMEGWTLPSGNGIRVELVD